MTDTKSKLTAYKITDKETGDSFRALPHTFGEGFVLFAPVEVAADINEWMNTSKLEAEGKLYRFENPNKDGKLFSEKYDIVLDGTLEDGGEKGE